MDFFSKKCGYGEQKDPYSCDTVVLEENPYDSDKNTNVGRSSANPKSV